jgi:hypothetical protein
VLTSPELAAVLPKSQMVQPDTPAATKEKRGMEMSFLNVVFFMIREDGKILSSNNKRFKRFVFWKALKF